MSLQAVGPLFPAVVALSPAVGLLFPAVVALLPAVGPLFYFLLIVYTVQCPSLFHRWFALRLFVTLLLVRALLLEPLIFDELLAHPRADPRVRLVVRWLHPPACTLFSTARCACSRCFLRSCGFVTWPLKLCAAVLMALHESPTMALHGLSVQFCFVVVAYLVHVAILLWSALAEGLRVDAIVWLSILHLGFHGCSPPQGLQSSLLWLVPGGQSGTLDSVTRFLIDRSACLVEPSFVLPCPVLPSSKHVRRQGRRSRITIAPFVIAVASPRFPSCTPGIFGS